MKMPVPASPARFTSNPQSERRRGFSGISMRATHLRVLTMRAERLASSALGDGGRQRMAKAVMDAERIMNDAVEAEERVQRIYQAGDGPSLNQTPRRDTGMDVLA